MCCVSNLRMEAMREGSRAQRRVEALCSKLSWPLFPMNSRQIELRLQRSPTEVTGTEMDWDSLSPNPSPF